MSDIHQEWHELRKKNGDFICHLDGEMDKLKNKQIELKRAEQLQHLTDAGAFTMQFVAPPPFNCCQDDRDILKALNKAQADRIEHLEDEITAYKQQQDVDLAIKKDLDEKLDKATADYRALWVMNEDLKHQLAGAKAQCENTVENRRRISELSQTVVNLREEIKRGAEQYAALETKRYNLAKTVSSMDKTIRDLAERNDNLRYTQQGMQSKIAKQSNEIKRLIDDNIHQDEYIETLKKKLNELTEETAATKTAYKFLKQALDTSAKDAEGNFDRGYHRGMDELWDAIRKAQEEHPKVLMDIYGQGCMHDCVSNLSAQDFAKKTVEWEEKQAKDIQIGDEVEIFDTYCPDDDPHSDFGIVVAVDSDGHCFSAIGYNFESRFDETDIRDGNVRKTGQHFDSIPLAYFA